MDSPRRGPARRGPWFTVVCVLLLGVFLIRNGSTDSAGGPPQPGNAVAAQYGSTDSLPPAPDPLPPATPRRITVPSVQVDAPLVPVGLDADGWVNAPPLENNNLAGWYAGAVSPGEQGTSVIVGHVDNETGPSVFYALGALGRGSRIEILRADGRTAVFTVYGIEVFTKRQFPAAAVYEDAPEPELRILTCGGDYSEKKGYDGNVVVFARLVEIR